ncbi:MFS transporter [Staphylococcus caledonicus]|uniref:MFS transporter n=1 Tax=Staphylococcus caledonicus TaxID=2741333 RepID=UPI003C2B4855
MKLQPNVKLRLLIMFMQNTSTNSVLPFMALLLTHYLGGRKAGVILIVGIAIKLISSILGGYISDTLKVKKYSPAFITFISALMYLGMGITLLYIENNNTIILLIFIILYLINEFMSAISKPMYNALALDSISEETRKKYSKVKYWVSNNSMALGMLIGGLFYNSYKTKLFILIFVSLFINVIILLIFIQETEKPKAISNKNFISQIFNSYKSVYKNKPFIIFLICGMMILSAEVSLPSYVAVRLKSDFRIIQLNSFEIDGIRMFSLLLILNTLTIVFLSFFILNRFKNLSSSVILKIGFILFAVGYTVVISNNNFYILVAFILIATIGEILFTPTYEAEKIKLIPVGERGSYSGLDSLLIIGAELLSRLFLIIGTLIPPILMSLLICIIVCSGFSLLLFTLSRHKTNKGITEI